MEKIILMASHHLSYQLRNQLMLLSLRYSSDMIHQVLGYPPIWILSAKLDADTLTLNERKQLHRQCSKYKSHKNIMNKMIKAEERNALIDFYHNDIVMAFLDTPF